MPWLIAGLVVLGLVWWEKSSKSAGTQASQLAAGLLMVVPSSDKQAVYAAQMNLVSRSARGDYATTPYAQSDVDANPMSPKFVTALAAFQSAANSFGDFAKAGLPFTSVRTDGVLDYATAALLNGSNAVVLPPGTQQSASVVLSPGGMVGQLIKLTPQSVITFQAPSVPNPVPGGTATLLGVISGLYSSNPAVVGSNGSWGQPTMTMPVQGAGSTNLTITWTDGNGVPQQSTLSVSAA